MNEKVISDEKEQSYLQQINIVLFFFCYAFQADYLLSIDKPYVRINKILQYYFY